MRDSGRQRQVALTSFVALFAIVGLALYGLPLYYDFMVTEFGWSRTQVTSGNALSKLVVGPAFGFLAGWIVDRFGPRRLMMAGILMAGGALVGLAHMTSLSTFYLFYLFNARGLCLRRTAAESSAPVTLVRPHAWKGDGLRVSGHRHRRHARAAPVGAAGGGAGLAWRAADARHSDHRACAPIRVFRTGGSCGFRRARRRRPRARTQRATGAGRGVSFEHLRSTCSRSAACARSRRSAERTSI